MKRFFTFMTAAVLAVGAYAQTETVWSPTNYTEAGTIEAETTLIDDEYVTVTNAYTTTVATATINDEAGTGKIGGKEFSAYMQIRVAKKPSSNYGKTGKEKEDCTSLVITPKKDRTFVFYYRRLGVKSSGASGDETYAFESNSEKNDLLIVNQSDLTTVLVPDSYEYDMENGKDNYAYACKSYTLTAGETYTVYNLGSTLYLYGISYTTDPSVTIGDIGYCTFGSTTSNYSVPDGVTAYTAELGDSVIELTPLADGIPANTGVVLGGTAGTYTLTATEEMSYTIESLLQISDGTITGDGSTIYVLGDNGKGEAVFAPLASGTTLPAGKCYFTNSSNAKALKVVVNDNPSGISEVKKAVDDGRIFNLQGMEMKNAGKGIFIINGKKVIR